MAACGLCILGVPEDEHTPERWLAITDEEAEIIHQHWRENPGVVWEDD